MNGLQRGTEISGSERQDSPMPVEEFNPLVGPYLIGEPLGLKPRVAQDALSTDSLVQRVILGVCLGHFQA